MPKKGGKSKNKNKGGKAGGAAAAATKKATDIQNPVTPGHEVEETVAKGEGEVSDVVTEPIEAATAGPTTTVPDATTNIPSAAPPASTEEAREILQDAVNKAETGLADKAALPNGEAIGAIESSVTEEPLKLTPENLAPTAGTETSLPERPKETVADTFDTHAKRPYEGSLTAKDDELPHKIAKVDDTVAAAGATSGHVAETGSLARKPEVPADTGSVQPQIVPGLGADPNDYVSTVLNVPGLSSVEETSEEKSTATSTAVASAVPVSSTSTEPKGAEDIAPTGAPTSDISADATEKPKDSEVSTAEEKTVATEPNGAEDIAPTGAPTSAGKADLVEQPKDSEVSKAEETVASEPPATAAAVVTSEPEAPSKTELTAAAAPSEIVATETATPSGATAPLATDSTANAASATAGAGTGTATSAPAPAAEPVLKVPSSIHEGPDSKVTSANQSAADQTVSKVEQETQGVSDSPQAALKDTIPEESQPAAEVQEGTAAVKDQLPESQPVAKEAQEAGTGAAKQPEEIQKPEEAKTKEPRAVQDAQEESAATAKKPEELQSEDIKKPEEAKTKEPQAAQAAPADTTSKPEEGKSLIDQGKEAVKTEASKAQAQAQETAKAEAAKLEKRKSGFFGWFKRKLKGEKA
ncbi:hypothetical protein ABOM_008163 [Aspergillus bombycis]|uniref:Uncharacterized protein n=1 Tax=Aspergillus bombycis TaxID=109264 RepID=A0A1F7ZUG2_9EURO|nr:hypothetical protein ABOM_008163 [Aspergillus bombycis]OGM42725.1 hypothetical protein ABOM_008163 [Aspergillus bombycis]